MKKIIFLIFLLPALSVWAQTESNCKTDSDCEKMGSGYTCQNQKIGCPGNEHTSTCGILVCRKPPTPAVNSKTKKKRSR